jgi:hypothetical protein
MSGRIKLRIGVEQNGLLQFEVLRLDNKVCKSESILENFEIDVKIGDFARV